MEKIKTLIIEDEALARDLLRNYLSQDERIEIVGECSNGYEGLLAIGKLNPDLVFLDIQMPKINGFEMLELLNNPPAIIFSTAYDQYAIKAFEANAIDYLLKPYPVERVATAINKVIEKINKESNKSEIEKLVSNHDEETGLINRIVVKSASKIHIIPVESIYYIESQDDFVMIYCREGHFMKLKTMKYFENHLDNQQFVRIHRSYLVNLLQIAEIQKYERDSWIVLTKQGAKIKVSKAGYMSLKEKLKI
jgi:two-component system, LytTR family, response regulator